MEFLFEILRSPYAAPVVMFVVSFFTSTGGVSGAFLLLPYQMSVMGIVTPSASATNQLYNVVAIPGGLRNYIKDGKMLWPLASAVVLGSLPGVFAGAIIRLEFLPDPTNFKLFAGLVLLYLGCRLVLSIFKKEKTRRPTGNQKIEVVSSNIKKLTFRFDGDEFIAPIIPIFVLSLLAGTVGGIYGIGGGAIMAPLLIGIYGLPAHAIAGAALAGTFSTSVAAVAFFQFLSLFYSGTTVAPDWKLGLLFGVGGLLGIFLGSKFQKYFSQTLIKIILTISILFIAGKYILEFIA